MNGVVIIGAGGHARVLVEALRARGQHVLGYVSDDAVPASGNMRDLPRLGDDRTLLSEKTGDLVLVNGVGMVGQCERRFDVFRKFRERGYVFETVIHPRAIVASDATIAEGVQIMAGAVIQAGVRIGIGTIVNSAASVDHDCNVGQYCHVAPRACLAGDVTVGDHTHVGIGATVIQNVRIGERVIVAAGAVVIANIPDNALAKGVPAEIVPHGTQPRTG